MATAVIAARPQSLGFRYYIHVLRQEIRYEFLKMLRMRVFSLSVVGFPVMFYLLFGVANRHTEFARYLLASYSCFGMVGASLFGLGAGIAGERVQGWLELKQASPMPRLAYLVAKTVSCAGFAMLIVALLITIGLTLGGVTMSVAEGAKLIGITLAGAIPFASMGLLLALLMPANAAPGVINLDAAQHAATLDAEDCAGSPDLSLCPARAEYLWLRAERHRYASALGGSVRLYLPDAGRCLAHLYPE
jgi:ABC-2 type transport system permease protein